MSWEALGAIGELVGAMGVIATLAYIAVQVRQNTRAIRGATLSAITQHQQFENRWSAEIGSSLRKAIHAPEEMSEDDAWQVQEWLTAAFLARQNEYSQYRQGLLERRVWNASEKIIRILMGVHWSRRWWETSGRRAFADDFVAEVDRIIAEGTFDPPSRQERLGRESVRQPDAATADAGDSAPERGSP